MYHENQMLSSEIANMRTRLKALQETVEVLTAKNTALLAEKATSGWITCGCAGLGVWVWEERRVW